MIPKADGVNEGLGPLPGAWGGELETQLEPGERPLAWFAPDLDNRLRYGASLLVLTDRRLIHGEPARPRNRERCRLAALAIVADPRRPGGAVPRSSGPRHARVDRSHGPPGLLALHDRPKQLRSSIHRSIRGPGARRPRRARLGVRNRLPVLRGHPQLVPGDLLSLLPPSSSKAAAALLRLSQFAASAWMDDCSRVFPDAGQHGGQPGPGRLDRAA